MAVSESFSQKSDDRGPASPGGNGRAPDVVALTGGKGGVGKTSVAVNLALTMARQGRRVLLLDGDTDLANVSILLGQYPQRTLEHAITGHCPLNDVIMEGPYGLHVIAGASGVQRCMDADVEDARLILQQLASLERNYDIILIDTASGLRPAGLHMIALAAMACVVITPDPASLTDAFSLLRVLQRRGYRRVPGVIVNMASGPSQAQSVHHRFAGAVRKHLSMDVDYIGAVWRDESIRQSVELQRPVATLAETDPSFKQFITLADQVNRHLMHRPSSKAGIAAYWQHRTRLASTPGEGAASETGAAPSVTPPRAASPAQDDVPAMHSPEPGIPAPRQCQNLFSQLEALLEDHSDDRLLQQEALKCTSALLLRIAAGSSDVDEKPAPGYSIADFGSQRALLERLRSEPDSVRVDGFLAGFSGACEQ
ncbi:MinD/ParA family ATP-binding protein [Marinobacter segnicrescens]|uniref:MinD/ParA family ATP-binding protein n=1 Tax=Marinobacter segnicrescens TaxID=430453 RepID=UPI003A90CBB6